MLTALEEAVDLADQLAAVGRAQSEELIKNRGETEAITLDAQTAASHDAGAAVACPDSNLGRVLYND